jgi:hypothetical protein
MFSLGAPVLFAQEPAGKFRPGYSAELNGTKILVIAKEGEPEWGIGMSSDQPADQASVDVFYRLKTKISAEPILLHVTSLCPILGPGAMAMTDRNFVVPLRDVQFIRITFFKTVGREEFR